MKGYIDLDQQNERGCTAALRRRRALVFGVVVAVVVGVVVGVVIGIAVSSKAEDPYVISADSIREHLRSLEAVARLERNRNSRSVLNGYNDSANYVLSRLEEFASFYDVSVHPFSLPIWTQLSDPTLELVDSSPPVVLQVCPQKTGQRHYRDDCDYAGLRYGGNGTATVEGRVAHVPGGGCQAEEWAGFPAGAVALVPVNSTTPGDCSYQTKALQAEAAGAAAAVVYLREATTYPGGRAWDPTWRHGEPLVQLPVIAVTRSVAQLLQQGGGQTVRLSVNQTLELAHTYNVVAETRAGDAGSVVMLGAHLDSVPEGPGVNDNGSGSATVLEAALELARQKRRPRNRVRFAWWGAEEVGLVGSRRYVDALVANPAEYDRVKLYLNFDMEASPNFIRFVHDAATASPDEVKSGCKVLEDLFGNYFTSSGIPWGKTGMGGGSDYYPFMLAGIPANGLASGAGGLKSIDDRAAHGGMALTQLDPCYHAPCDTVDNISMVCLTDFAAAIAHVLEKLMNEDLGALLPPRRAVSAEQYAALLLQQPAEED